MTGRQRACPNCAAIAGRDDRCCESCGAALSEIRRAAIPTQPDRDEVVLDGVALITDRGLERLHNEDAAAAGILIVGGEPPSAIAVAVCDGVSTSSDAHTAAAAASKAGVAAMLAALAASRKPRSAVLAGLADAAEAAAAAGDGVDPSDAPSCTYTAAALALTPEGAVQITVGNVGDSRVYWLPEPPAPAQRLTVDDTLAQELIACGAEANSEAVHAGVHALTRWLGADSEAEPWSESSVRTITTAGPGSLLLCTDGLWNYLPEGDDIARFCTGTDATAAARALVEHALQAGGQDNVTVVVVPIAIALSSEKPQNYLRSGRGEL